MYCYDVRSVERGEQGKCSKRSTLKLWSQVTNVWMVSGISPGVRILWGVFNFPLLTVYLSSKCVYFGDSQTIDYVVS